MKNLSYNDRKFIAMYRANFQHFMELFPQKISDPQESPFALSIIFLYDLSGLDSLSLFLLTKNDLFLMSYVVGNRSCKYFTEIWAQSLPLLPYTGNHHHFGSFSFSRKIGQTWK